MLERTVPVPVFYDVLSSDALLWTVGNMLFTGIGLLQEWFMYENKVFFLLSSTVAQMTWEV